MAWNGSGVFSRLYSWVARRDAGSPTNIIDATTMDAEFDNYKSGLENCRTIDGQNTATANLPMGTFRHTNVGAAALRTQYGRVTELQDGVVWRAESPGGTVDAMTGTLAPAPSVYTAGMWVTIIVPGTGSNTVTAPTINLNGLGAKTIRKHQAALVAGDYTVGDTLHLVYDGTYFELLNSKYPVSVAATSIDLNGLTTDATGGAVGDFIPFVDVSGSNSSDKVTTQDLFTNVFANFTADATGGATGDKLLFSDASESNAAQTVTVDNLLINGLQLLTTDATGGATGDFIAFADASESNAGNKVTVADLFYNAITNATDDTSPETAADFVVTRDNSASTYKKVRLDRIGVGKQTVWVPAAAMTSRTTNGAATGTTESTTNKVMNKVLDFDTTTQEFAQFTVAFPKGWNEGTVTFIPYWTAASGSGGVVWGLAGVALSNDDVIDTAFGTAVTSSDTLIATTDIHVGPESAAITIAGTPAVDDICYFQVNRTVADGGDTLGVDARLIGIKLLYTIDSNVDD
jgi:hypothetical protein